MWEGEDLHQGKTSHRYWIPQCEMLTEDLSRHCFLKDGVIYVVSSSQNDIYFYCNTKNPQRIFHKLMTKGLSPNLYKAIIYYWAVTKMTSGLLFCLFFTKNCGICDSVERARREMLPRAKCDRSMKSPSHHDVMKNAADACSLPLPQNATGSLYHRITIYTTW